MDDFDFGFHRLTDDHKVVRMERPTHKQMAEVWEYENRKVGNTEIGDYRISTVFLVIDHGWFGEHKFFETMIFGGAEEFDEFQWRYSTWDEAVAGHEQVCELVRMKEGKREASTESVGGGGPLRGQGDEPEILE